jgi:hypothetical protein
MSSRPHRWYQCLEDWEILMRLAKEEKTAQKDEQTIPKKIAADVQPTMGMATEERRRIFQNVSC